MFNRDADHTVPAAPIKQDSSTSDNRSSRRTTPPGTRAMHVFLNQRLLLRWVYAGRLLTATAIVVAALRVWTDQPGDARLALTMLGTVFVITVASAIFSESSKKTLPAWFLMLQSVTDLLVVTVIVDMRGSAQSPFTALYIVVIALGFLLLPSALAVTVTVLGALLYGADVFFRMQSAADLAPASLQILVMAIVATVSHTVSASLRTAGAGSAALAAQLEDVKMQAADILSTIRSGIITVDAKGRLLQANPAAAQLLGIEFDGYLDRPVLSKIHEVSPDLAEMLVRTIKRPTRINRGEATMPRNGSSIPIGVTTTYAESRAGIPSSATAIFQDISELKRTELLSLRAERLAAVAELSASLAHEIKNPLASIRSAVEQLARVQYAGEDERTLAALVQRESDRLSRLLSEFLDFSRAQASEFRTLDIVAVAKGACALVVAHPDCQASVQLSVAPSADVIEMEGDEDLLHRAIFNLALNAAQASLSGGEVTVTVSTAPAAGMPAPVALAEEAVQIVVRDCGVGIPPEMRERLFDPFFTTKAGGSGLGLSVVHRAITSHGGVVLVDSGEDGTQFTILVPRTKTARGQRS